MKHNLSHNVSYLINIAEVCLLYYHHGLNVPKDYFFLQLESSKYPMIMVVRARQKVRQR